VFLLHIKDLGVNKKVEVNDGNVLVELPFECQIANLVHF